MLKFEPITKYEKGVVFSLLSRSFAEVLNDSLEEKMKQVYYQNFKVKVSGKCRSRKYLGD